LYFILNQMSQAADTATILGSVGCATGLIGLSFGIAALAVTLEDRNTINSLQDQLDNVETTTPLLVNDGQNVFDSNSILGVPPVTGQETQTPMFHFKSITAGTNLSITDAVTNLVVSNTLIVTLQSNPSSSSSAFSLPSASSSPNAPEVRKLIAGSGITITLDSEDNLIISAP
jgi:hypothetical protein